MISNFKQEASNAGSGLCRRRLPGGAQLRSAPCYGACQK